MAAKNEAKLTLMVGTLAFQLQVVTMAYLPTFGTSATSQGQAVEALMIIALVLLTVAEVLMAEITFVEAELAKIHKAVCICAIVLLWVAALCVLVAISVYGAAFNSAAVPYEYTTYVTTIAAAIVAGILLIRVIKAQG